VPGSMTQRIVGKESAAVSTPAAQAKRQPIPGASGSMSARSAYGTTDRFNNLRPTATPRDLTKPTESSARRMEAPQSARARLEATDNAARRVEGRMEAPQSARARLGGRPPVPQSSGPTTPRQNNTPTPLSARNERTAAPATTRAMSASPQANAALSPRDRIRGPVGTAPSSGSTSPTSGSAAPGAGARLAWNAWGTVGAPGTNRLTRLATR
jgi:hypothetical protein